jgi:hypothetical protein
MLKIFKGLRFLYLSLGLILMIKNKFKYNIGSHYFIFWLFIWTNSLNKYESISESDFDIESIDDNFDFKNLIPVGYLDEADEKIPYSKIKAQVKATTAQLERVIKIHTSV